MGILEVSEMNLGAGLQNEVVVQSNNVVGGETLCGETTSHTLWRGLKCKSISLGTCYIDSERQTSSSLYSADEGSSTESF